MDYGAKERTLAEQERVEAEAEAAAAATAAVSVAGENPTYRLSKVTNTNVQMPLLSSRKSSLKMLSSSKRLYDHDSVKLGLESFIFWRMRCFLSVRFYLSAFYILVATTPVFFIYHLDFCPHSPSDVDVVVVASESAGKFSRSFTRSPTRFPSLLREYHPHSHPTTTTTYRDTVIYRRTPSPTRPGHELELPLVHLIYLIDSIRIPIDPHHVTTTPPPPPQCPKSTLSSRLQPQSRTP